MMVACFNDKRWKRKPDDLHYLSHVSKITTAHHRSCVIWTINDILVFESSLMVQMASGHLNDKIPMPRLAPRGCVFSFYSCAIGMGNFLVLKRHSLVDYLNLLCYQNFTSLFRMLVFSEKRARYGLLSRFETGNTTWKLFIRRNGRLHFFLRSHSDWQLTIWFILY